MGEREGREYVSFMVSSDHGLGESSCLRLYNWHRLLPQSPGSLPAKSSLSTILEGKMQAHNGRETQSRSHSTSRSRAEARPQRPPVYVMEYWRACGVVGFSATEPGDSTPLHPSCARQ